MLETATSVKLPAMSWILVQIMCSLLSPADQLTLGSRGLDHRIKDHPKNKIDAMMTSVTGLPRTLEALRKEDAARQSRKPVLQ